jgi:hypothetical protein
MLETVATVYLWLALLDPVAPPAHYSWQTNKLARQSSEQFSFCGFIQLSLPASGNEYELSSATSRFATASPIPLLPPVITAISPCNAGMF